MAENNVEQVPPALLAKQSEANAEWAAFLGGLDAKQKAVLRKYTILNREFEPTVCSFLDRSAPPSTDPKKKPIVFDVKLSLPVVQRLVAADKTAKHLWLDWIFYQAAGGDAGKVASEKMMETVKNRFIAMAKNAGRTPQQADLAWQKKEPKIRELIEVGDEDTVISGHGVFGFYRNWPGENSIYATVVEAVTRFLSHQARAKEMDQSMIENGGQPISLTPESLRTLVDLQQLNVKIDKFVKAQHARSDIKLAPHKSKQTIYSDDVIFAIAPLTYAAAVRYGWDNWSWANREQFEQDMAEPGSARTTWQSMTGRGSFFVYLEFKVPVPAWVVSQGGKFDVFRLTNLALVIPAHSLGGHNETELKVYNEEGDETTLKEVRDMIMSEPERQDAEDDVGMGVRLRGANVYKTPEKAYYVLNHFNLCIKTVLKWATQFSEEQARLQAKGAKSSLRSDPWEEAKGA